MVLNSLSSTYNERNYESIDIYPSKFHSLECYGHVSNQWIKDFGCTRPLKHSNTFFIGWILIWEHPNCKYEFYSLDLYYYIVFEAIYSIVLDLEISKDRCMNPTRSKEWK